MTDLQQQWLKQVEDYYRDTYPRSMRAKVAEILPHKRQTLSALYNTLIESHSAQYRTVPDVAAIRAALRETAEAYPELTASAALQLTEGELPNGAEYLGALARALSSGRDPRSDERVAEAMREAGYAGE